MGFLEKTLKKLEIEKALAKMMESVSHKQFFTEDSNDLCHFLSKGTPYKYGGKEKQCNSDCTTLNNKAITSKSRQNSHHKHKNAQTPAKQTR